MSALPLYVTRRGLPHAGRLLTAGRPITVAYLGGSITQAYPDGYAYQLTAWLKQQYPAAAITEVNAGIGGTGSDFGVFRLRQDVLRHSPDLLFVEFAVNDSHETHDVCAAMEGIVRHTRRVRGDACDIAFIYTLSQPLVTDLQEERLPPASRLHEPVAEHYGLTSINVALDVARRLKAGALTWDQFAGDSAHPHPSGHTLYCNTLAACLPEAFAVAPGKAPSPAPLTRDPWEFGDMIPVPPATRFPGWNYVPMVNRGGWECFDGMFESNATGSEAAFDFTGTAVGVFFRLGPETGDLDWAVDNAAWQTTRVFDDYSLNFWRPCYRVLDRKLAPGPHRLRLKISADRDPRSKGNWTKLAALMVENPLLET